MHRFVKNAISVASRTGNILVWISVGVFFLWAVGAIYYLQSPNPLPFTLF